VKFVVSNLHDVVYQFTSHIHFTYYKKTGIQNRFWHENIITLVQFNN